MVEDSHYKTLEETYQVQRCFTGKDRVYDSTFKIDTTTKNDYQCCNVETPNCYMEEQVINDVTCTITVEFNCQREMSTKNDGYGQKEVVCTRTHMQNCYNIPRKVCRLDNYLVLFHFVHCRSKLRFAKLIFTASRRWSCWMTGSTGRRCCQHGTRWRRW